MLTGECDTVFSFVTVFVFRTFAFPIFSATQNLEHLCSLGLTCSAGHLCASAFQNFQLFKHEFPMPTNTNNLGNPWGHIPTRYTHRIPTVGHGRCHRKAHACQRSWRAAVPCAQRVYASLCLYLCRFAQRIACLRQPMST